MELQGETIFLLAARGHFRHVVSAFKKTKEMGIQTNHFRALIHWDDGVAGVPALICKVYGLPQAQLNGIVSFCMNALFIFTSTRAMAHFIVDEIDMHIGVVDEIHSSPRSVTPFWFIGRSESMAS